MSKLQSEGSFHNTESLHWNYVNKGMTMYQETLFSHVGVMT